MMAQKLAEQGYEVKVVVWRRGKSGLDAPARNVSFHRLRLSAPYGINAVLGLLLWLTYCLVWLLTHEYDVVQPQNFDNLIPVLLVRRLKKFTIVYDLADFYSDAYLPQRSHLRRPIAKLERLALSQVNALVLVSELQELQTSPAALPVNRAVIYNIPSVAEIAVGTSQTEHSRHLGDPIHLFFAGTISRERCDFLLALSRVVERIPEVYLELAGFGDSSHRLERELRANANSVFLGALSRTEVMTTTARCDCVVLPYDPSLRNYRIALSNKFFEAMALGKILLAPKGTLMGQLVEKFEIGFVTNFSDQGALKQTLLEIVAKRDSLSQMGDRGKKAFERYSSAVSERLSSLYGPLQHGASSG